MLQETLSPAVAQTSIQPQLDCNTPAKPPGDRTTFIYVLKCPISGEVRYVGKADRPKTRFVRHLLFSKVEKFRKANWIRSLLNRGLKPVLEVIHEVPYEHWPAFEAAYIIFYKEDCGCRLVNSTPGGQGGGSGKDHPCFGKPLSAERKAKLSARRHSKESIEKMRAAKKGKKFSAEHREKLAVAKRGTHIAPATKAKLAEYRGPKHHLFGKPRLPEIVAKVAAAQKGRKLSPGHRAILIAALTGRKVSQETREKLRKAHTGRKPTLEARANMSAAQLGSKHHLFGKHLPLETRLKLSAARKRVIAAKKDRSDHQLLLNI